MLTPHVSLAFIAAEVLSEARVKIFSSINIPMSVFARWHIGKITFLIEKELTPDRPL